MIFNEDRTKCAKCGILPWDTTLSGIYKICTQCMVSWSISSAAQMWRKYVAESNFEMCAKVDEMWIGGEFD